MPEYIGKFKIEYAAGGEGGPIKDEGWRVYEESWHTHRQGQPVKKNKHPRWKLVKVCETRDEAIAWVQHR